MAQLYADEQFPRAVSQLLRNMGHDVLTVQEAGNANLGIPDDQVLAFAISNNRAVCHHQSPRLYQITPR